MVEEWCSLAKKGGCVGNTYFKQRSLHKYTRVAKGQDGVEIKSMTDLVTEGYAAIYTECEDGERDGRRPLRPP